MTTKHTPGPWYVENDRRMIADEEDGPVCYFYPRDNGSDLHNANLIAAAPDLLKACEALVEAQRRASAGETGGFGLYLDAVELARATVEKLKGDNL